MTKKYCDGCGDEMRNAGARLVEESAKSDVVLNMDLCWACAVFARDHLLDRRKQQAQKSWTGVR